MSQENVELLKRTNAALNGGDIARVREALHPDVVFEDRMPAPDVPSVVRGVDAVLEGLSEWLDALTGLPATVEEYIDAGNWVICVTLWRGTGSGGGTPLELRVADTYEVREGKIVRAVVSYGSLEEALEAVGASE